MPTLSELFNLDPKVERLALMPRLRGSLGSDYGVSPEMQNSVMFEGKKGFMPDVIAPKVLYDFIRAIKAPGRAARGEVLDEEEALNTALNMFGGGLATSGSVPIGALGMSARTAPAGTLPLREVTRSPLGFYSKVEEATLPLQNKGSGGQFLAQIQKTPGVKPEEIEVLGLDKFLQSKPTVTKQKVQDYIIANKPDVQEVRLDSAKTLERKKLKEDSFKALEQVDQAIPNLSQLDRANLTTFWAAGAQAGNRNDLAKIRSLNLSENQMEAVMNYGAAVNRQRNFIESSNGYMAQPKFSQYTIPGGENYREILMTLPERKPNTEALARLEDATKAYKQNASYENYQALNNARLEVGADWDKMPSAQFRSSHYDQPNILTHLRANDRVIDGKKALFIEEIQSDWHQAGRKSGYATGKFDRKATTATRQSGFWEVRDQNGDFVTNVMDYTLPNADEQAVLRFADLRIQKNDATNVAASKRVPDAPFKKSWHELALKRAIQEAVDKGYDKLAFTTGKTQAERYDLSKQVSTLRAPYDNGEYVVSYIPKGANDYEYMGRFLEKDLPDAVGKELAEKIVANKDIQTMTYKGDDLRVGGEGMKGFYDEILPKALQNLTKKYGTKVTKTTMKAGQDVTEPGIVAPGVGMEFAGKTTKAPEVEVWSMDITPQMREQIASKGQPLFASAPPLGLASQDPLEQFLQTDEARNDPLMQFLGYK